MASHFGAFPRGLSMLRPLAWIHLVVLLLSLTGCKGDPKEPAYWDKQLNGARRIKEKERILSDLRESGNLNPSFLPMLHGHLSSEKQPEVKAAVARLLREVGNASSVGPLMDAVDLGNTDGTANAMNKEIAAALGRIGDAKSAPLLIRLLASRDQYVRIEAINALGTMRAKEAVQPLTAIATDQSGEPFVSKKAIQALGEIGDPASVPPLIRMMFKENRGVTFYVESSFALFQIGRPAADALVRVLDGQDTSLVSWARQNNVIEPAIYAKTAQVLGDLLDRRAEKALLSHLSFNSEYLDLKLFVRMRVADALGRLRSKEAVKPLLALISEEEEPTAREEYVRALARIGGREALGPLLKMAAKGSWSERQPVLLGVAMLGGADELAAFSKLGSAEESLTSAECKASPGTAECRNPGELAAKRSKWILGSQKLLQSAQQCGSNAGCWAKQLQDPNERLRERAAYELGRSGKAEMVEPLIAQLSEANLDVRLAVIQALDWLILDTREAAQKASASLDKIERQLAQERGRTEFAKVNEDLRRLAAQLKRLRA
jgi:HEAT repeat protein